MGNTSGFFSQLKDHSEVKLRIFRKYVRPWAAKLGFKVRARGQNNLWYVDGFAGEGRYEADGADGSPIIAAKYAAQFIDEGRDYRLGCVNVELKRDRKEKLDRLTEEFIDRGVTIRNLNMDFSDSIPKVLEIIGDRDPALVFIDPFGLKPLNFDQMRPLLSRHGETDVFLTFMTSALPRLAAENPKIISDAIGTETWTIETVLPQFAANLAREGRFLGIASYPIRARRGGPAPYHLLLGSRSPDAFELMNDSVVEEDRDLDRKWFAQAAQAHFLDWIDAPTDRQRLLEAIEDHGIRHPTTTRDAIVRDLILRRFGEWHTGDIRKAVRGLIEAGRILRRKEGRGRIDTDSLTFA